MEERTDVHDSPSKLRISPVGFLLLVARVKMMVCCVECNRDIIPKRSKVNLSSLELVIERFGNAIAAESQEI